MESAVLSAISICAGNIRVTQDANFATMLPGQAQTLPLEYVSSWPVWVCKERAQQQQKVPVIKVPVPEEGRDLLDTWVNPGAFEQLWLPDDLPTPRAIAAIGVVLRNGEPRYVFPTIDTFLETSDGTKWRNRGLNSVPLAKTWLHFGEIPIDDLRMSAYSLAAPAADEAAANADADADADASSVATTDAADDADGESTGFGAWQCVLPNRAVHGAIDHVFDTLDALPPPLRKTSLGDGFCFLVSPLQQQQDAEEDSGGEGGGGGVPLLLPDDVIAPGARLRAFLSEEGADTDEDCWQRGELDLTSFRLPPGSDSPYMQQNYRGLFDHEWG